MLRDMTDRFSRWFNGLRGDRPVYYFFGFCLVFLVLLWLCVRYIQFDANGLDNRLPANIGKPSGLLPNDPLTLKKH